MRYYYVDSSALAKNYVLEPDSSRVRNIVKSTRVEPPTARVLVSIFAHVEVQSAINAHFRRGTISNATAKRLAEDVGRDFSSGTSSFVILGFSEQLALDANGHVQMHGLRAADALHLATGMAAKFNAPVDTDFYFVTADGDLADAAEAEIFQVERLQPWTPLIPR